MAPPGHHPLPLSLPDGLGLRYGPGCLDLPGCSNRFPVGLEGRGRPRRRPRLSVHCQAQSLLAQGSTAAVTAFTSRPVSGAGVCACRRAEVECHEQGRGDRTRCGKSHSAGQRFQCPARTPWPRPLGTRRRAAPLPRDEPRQRLKSPHVASRQFSDGRKAVSSILSPRPLRWASRTLGQQPSAGSGMLSATRCRRARRVRPSDQCTGHPQSIRGHQMSEQRLFGFVRLGRQQSVQLGPSTGLLRIGVREDLTVDFQHLAPEGRFPGIECRLQRRFGGTAGDDLSVGIGRSFISVDTG